MLFLSEGLVSSSSEDFPFSKITSVEFRSKALVLGTILIHASGNAAEITNVDGSIGRRFVDLARQKIARSGPTPKGPAPLRNAVTEVQARDESADHISLLKQLRELHQNGVLSDEEFATKKTEILRRL